MTNITAWREFLGKSIVDPHERQRIANELGVSTVTLTRWSNGISNPRPQNLRHLLRALPQHRTTLAELFMKSFLTSYRRLGTTRGRTSHRKYR